MINIANALPQVLAPLIASLVITLLKEKRPTSCGTSWQPP